MQSTEELRDYCLQMPGVTEGFPFDDKVLVFKVGGKIFALSSIAETTFRVNLKCDPQRALQLREAYTAVQPGYHMNKKLWNTITPAEGLPPDMLPELVQHSYHLVKASLPKKVREQLH